MSYHSTEHAGRFARFHANDRAKLFRLHCTGGSLCRSDRRDRDQRGMLHYDRSKRRGDGARYDHWRRASSVHRRLPQRRGTKSAVKESASISAEKALELKVIDLIAPDLPDLLQKLNGRVVDGKTLKTAGAEVAEVRMSPSERIFQKLWRPEVMFILMLIAIYGIIGELTTPGAILPGVVGAIALILALYLAAILPVNVTGLALIALALMLFIFDVYATTHGVLTVGGIIAFLIGSLMLFNRADPLFRLSLNYIIPATLVTAAFFIFVIGKGLRAQLLPVKVGAGTLIGKTVTALTPIDSRGGRIFVEGEYWNAVSDVPIEKGEQTEIAAVQGLTVKLKAKGE